MEVPTEKGKVTTMQQQTASVPPAAPSGAPAPAKPEEPTGGIAHEVFEFIWETFKVVAIALLIILPVRYFLVQPFFVKGSSMVPNFHDQEYILVDKWSYRLGRPERGDVIIFKAPTNPKEYFIKRILGLPGESVLAGQNQVIVFNERYPDGFVVYESDYLPAENPTYCGANTTWCGTKVTLGDDEYYVMGDNREHSSDSRFFGPVHRGAFAGMAWLRLWPLDNITHLQRYSYPPIQR